MVKQTVVIAVFRHTESKSGVNMLFLSFMGVLSFFVLTYDSFFVCFS